MRECLYIGPTPSYEDCAQVGSDDYTLRARREYKAFQNQILRAYPIPPELEGFTRLGVSEGEVVVYYRDNDDASLEYALMVEADKRKRLQYWDEDAKKELLIEPQLKKGEFVEVSALPNCDICSGEGSVRSAKYDARIVHGSLWAGSWANLCEKHFGLCGCSLGVGRGQMLILKNVEVQSESN